MRAEGRLVLTLLWRLRKDNLIEKALDFFPVFSPGNKGGGLATDAVSEGGLNASEVGILMSIKDPAKLIISDFHFLSEPSI